MEQQVDSPRFCLRTRVVNKTQPKAKVTVPKASNSLSQSNLPSISVNVSSSTRID